jgi:UDP-N-acetylmuramoyl-tripeptide--D-alanyl-D-alanine ligase
MTLTPLWSIEELLAATGGTLKGAVSGPWHGVSIDSRSVSAGDVFVAIKGDTMDGHDFVAAALNNGATLAIVSRLPVGLDSNAPLLVVADDVLKALERIAMAARQRSHARLIAVTGSVGKTSTKEMLRVALSASAETHASSASFNNHWGVPLTLARLSTTAGFGVFEIGMNHGGEITPLVGFVRPHLAIVTSIAASHLGNFNSIDEIAAAKAEIFTGVVEGGSALIPIDSPHYEFLKSAAAKAGISNIYSFGRGTSADIQLEALALRPDCCCIRAKMFGEIVTYKLGVPGEHMALNSLVVMGAAKLVGADVARAALALADAKPAKGRGGQTRLGLPDGEAILLDESYNANPTSVAAGLALLAQLKTGKNGRRIAVLGDMLELGQFGPDLHRGLLASLEKNKIDVVYVTGPLMKHLWSVIPLAMQGGFADTSTDLVPKLCSDLRAGDCVMVKGSLGSRMGPVVEALKSKWPPRNEETV